MQHPDEGTIHGWLDGALSEVEAARVEQHVRECAQCSAAVAEARGLIAVSSRILAALDAVPGDVVPSRPPPSRVAPRAWRRSWRSPALAAAAAVLLVVGVSFAVLQGTARSDLTAALEAGARQSRGAAMMDTAVEAVPSAERVAAAPAAVSGGLPPETEPSPVRSAPPPPPRPAPAAPQRAPATPLAAAAERTESDLRAQVLAPTGRDMPRLPVSPDTMRLRLSEVVVTGVSPAQPDSLGGRVVAANVERPRAESVSEPDPLTRGALLPEAAPRAAARPAPGDAAAHGARVRGAAPAAPPAAVAQARAGFAADAADTLVQLLVISETVDTTLVGVMRTVVYEVRPGIHVTHQTIERRFRPAGERRAGAPDSAAAEPGGERTLLRMDLGRVQAIHWTDAAGMYHSLSGPVEQEELQRIRATLNAARGGSR